MAYERRTNIPYTTNAVDDPFRQFDIYFSTPSEDHDNTSSSSLICFVHGGAWVSGDKQEHELLASRLLAATGYPVAVPNYRLTPRTNKDPDPSNRHPMHVMDLIDFLEFIIIAWIDPPCRYDPSRIILIGHSCSAHMISSVFFIPPMEGVGVGGSLITSPRSPSIVESTTAVILSEGIYDIDSLVQSFPNYRASYIEPTFGPGPYDKLSILNSTLRDGAGFRWLLIHTEGDTLVDVYQTNKMHDHLRSLDAVVDFTFFDVGCEHDAILETEIYVNSVKGFLLSST